MTNILELFLIIAAAVLIYKLVFYVIKRCVAIRKILTLKGTCGAAVSFLRFPFTSFFRLSETPDAVVETDDSVYLVRFIDTPSGGKHLHFASESFFVTYTSTHWSLGGLLHMRRRYRAVAAGSHSTSAAQRVRILPQLKIPEVHSRKKEIYAKKLVPVLLFNPAPKELSYVTKEKTSIKVAFTGDEVYGQKVFTATTFAIHVDRATREAKNKIFY
ncbi:MAG: hypothetical protein J6V09_01025 [Clostridia bacterium]|nr:hypothetical protein [Clostridia bacterium]